MIPRFKVSRRDSSYYLSMQNDSDNRLSKPDLTIALIGGVGTGKTSLASTFVEGKPVEYLPVLDIFELIITLDKKNYRVDIIGLWLCLLFSHH